MNMNILIYGMIYLGSAVMMYSIVRYFRFEREIERGGIWEKVRKILLLPLVMMILFLAGYLAVGLFGRPDLIISAILFGGSLFVALMTHAIRYVTTQIRARDRHLEILYGEMRGNLEDLTRNSLSVFRVNLTTDAVEERGGENLYASDRTAKSYSQLLSLRQPHYSGSLNPLRREALLAELKRGRSEYEQTLLCRREDGRNMFVRIRAALAFNPSTDSVMAFITEQEFNQEMVQDAVRTQVLGQQYDITAYLLDGQMQIVEAGGADGRDCTMARKGESVEYENFVGTRIAAAICAEAGEHEAVLESLQMKSIRSALSHGNSYEVEFSVRMGEETAYKRFAFYPVDREADFYILLVSDITKPVRDQLRQNEELRLALQAARQASTAKTAFLSSMSHDIRTPMNAIIGFTRMAGKEGTPPEQMRDYIGKIESSGKHLLALINDILEMTRIESGKISLEESETDLKELTGGIRDLFAAQMKEKQVAFITDCSEVSCSRVICDRGRMNRMLMNLVSNAYKFTPAGGQVSVSLRQVSPVEDGFAEFEYVVRDTGIGMSEEFAARIFEAFERERTATVSGIEGSGLGMAITKSIVDLMGGTIRVRTAPGEGTAFTVSLRLRCLVDSCREEIAVPAAADPEAFSGKGLRLLLVEDMAVNREIALLLLQELGFETEVAINGLEAVERLEQAEAGYFQAVLMDIQMPIMDGYEAARRIRALPDAQRRSVPIIAITANAFAEDVMRAKEAGMDAHVSKPIHPEELRAVLAQILAGAPVHSG